MSTFVELAVTGLSLGALYFLVAGGLSLIYGLMRVLNLAHGAFLTVGAYLGYEIGAHAGRAAHGWPVFFLALLVGAASSAVFAALTELLLIRRLYEREIEQVLVTLGVSFAAIAVVTGVWGNDAIPFPAPDWTQRTTTVLGAAIPNKGFVCIIAAAVVLGLLLILLRRTRYGLVIRAGVENRAMVTALGIDVRRYFTVVFTLGGAVAGLGGVLASLFFDNVSPDRGNSLLIFAFIVVVIGGVGSLVGSAIAAAVMAEVQQFVNFYGATGLGDFSVVLVLAIVLLARPGGLIGRAA